MKKTAAMLLGCIIALQVCGFVYASDDKECKKCEKKCMGQNTEKMQAKHLDKLTKELNLTPEQKDKISAIMKESGEKKKAEMQKMRENAKAEMEAKDKSIDAVLTPEQAQKFENMQAERKAKMEKKMKKGHHDEEQKK
jgi:Spy/CpxP family protein refolding chaperone